MKIKNLTIIFALFMTLLCCFSAVSASENVTDDSIAVADDVAVDEVVGEVDSGDESISVENEDEIVSEDDSDVLGDYNYHDKIYVNVSSSNDRTVVDGQSWENAYGGNRGLTLAIQYINENGTIYVADGTYSKFNNNGNFVNYNIIGMSKEKTIFTQINFINKDIGADSAGINHIAYTSDLHPIATFINITFSNPSMELTNEKVFINCRFINVPIKSNYDVYSQYVNNPSDFDNYGIGESFVVNFTNCEFVNYTQNLLNAYTTSKVNFNNCTFVNVTANSIATHTGDLVLEDSLNFYRCTFDNVNVKGIVDVPTGANLGEHYNIEYCEGVDDFGVIADGEHNYINSTKSKSETNLVSSVDKDENLLINLTSVDGSDMANETVSISVNGGEFTNHTLGANGILSIPVKSLTNLTGKVTIVVFYGDNDYYIGNMSKTEYVIPVATNTQGKDSNTPVKKVNPVATKITAKKKTTFKAKKKSKKYSITLKAGKKAVSKVKVTIKVGKKTYKATTNKKGKATFKLKKLTKKGKYKAVIKFAGNSKYKASTKKVKIIIK